MEAQQEQNNETNTTLLTYAVNTLPNPVEVTEQVNLELVVSNTRPNEVVYLKDIGIQLLPTDPSLPVLTDDPSKFSCTVTPAGIWNITNQGGVVTLTSQSGKSQAITTDGISIQLSGATVNAQTGTCYINIAEVTTDADSNNSITHHAPEIGIAKFPQNFSLSNFAASPAELSPDGSVTLSWQMTRVSGCSLILTWNGESQNVTDQNQFTVPASNMSDTTVFTLTASVATASGTVSFERQIIANIQVPTISNFAVSRERVLVGAGDSITLSWNAKNIDYCALYSANGTLIQSNILPPSNNSNSYSYTFNAPT